MLMLLSRAIPLFTPDTAEMMKATVRTDMATTTNPLPSNGLPVRIEVPVRIWSAPIPSEVAVPNRVTSTAATSMILPRTRFEPSGKIGLKTAEISGTRPRR